MTKVQVKIGDSAGLHHLAFNTVPFLGSGTGIPDAASKQTAPAACQQPGKRGIDIKDPAFQVNGERRDLRKQHLSISLTLLCPGPNRQGRGSTRLARTIVPNISDRAEVPLPAFAPGP